MSTSAMVHRPLLVAVVVALAAAALATPPGTAAAVATTEARAVTAPAAVARGAAVRPAKHHPKVRCGNHKAAVRVTAPKAGKHKHRKGKWRCVKVPRKLVKQRSPQQQLVRAGTRLPAVRVGGKTYQLHTPPVFARSLQLGVPRLPASLFSGATAPSGYLTARRAPDLKGSASIDIAETGAHLELDGDFSEGNMLLDVTITTKSGDSMHVSYGFGATIDTCPDARGKVHGTARSGTELHFDLPRSGYQGEWPMPGPPDSRVFLHLSMGGKGKGTAQASDTAKVDSFDLHTRMLNHVQIGTKSASGTVLQTSEPRVLQVDADTVHAPRVPDDEAEMTAWARQVVARTTFDGYYRASDWGGQAEAEKLYQEEWGTTTAAFGLGLNTAEQKHWTKVGDCLDVRLAATRTTLRPGQSTKITATLVPKNGPKVAKAALTGKATAGTVSPDKASSAEPVTFRFTAPRKKWDNATVTVRAISRQGAGKGQITLSRQRDSYQLVFATDLRQTFVGTSSGAAHWVGTAKPALKETADGVWSGATGYGWSTYQYADHGDPMVCQAGGYGHEDVDAAGTTPGRLTVTRLTGADAGPAALSVQLRVQAPVDTLRNSFFHDATSCTDFSSTYAWSIWPPLRWQLATKPGVAMTGSGNDDSALFTITGWTKGTGAVLAYKDIAWTQSGGIENYHVRLELRAQQ